MGGRLGRHGEVAMEEVEKHLTKDDAWLVLFGEVYDVTKFIPLHPGGADMITAYLGKDATADWQEIHKMEHLEKYQHSLTKMGRIRNRPMLDWLWSITGSRPATSSAFNAQFHRQGESSDEEEETSAAGASDEVQPLRWNAMHEAELPAGGVFDLQELSRWNGVDLPMCIGVCGVVVDVSSSDNFVPNFGYGKLWAGRDTTWAMATVSLKDYDANKLDFKLEDLTEDQAKALAGWYKHFTAKYRKVGTLKELRDWDFSSVRRQAATLPTSSMSSTGDNSADN